MMARKRAGEDAVLSAAKKAKIPGIVITIYR